MGSFKWKLFFFKTSKKPKPVKEYTKLIKKFNHLSEQELDILQKDIDYEYSILKAMTELEIEIECPLPISA